MKLVDVIQAVESLKVLVEKPMKAKAAYVLSLLITKLDAEYKTYDAKRNDLIKKYGTEVNGMTTVDPNGPKGKAFFEELNGLLDTELSLEITKIKLAAIEDIEVEAKHILALKPFIEE
jgi:hypothetical protein